MGQHKHNPTAIAAKNGELPPKPEKMVKREFERISYREIERVMGIDCRNSMLWRKPTDTVIGECLIRKMNSEDEEFCQVGADDFCSYGERRSDDERP